MVLLLISVTMICRSYSSSTLSPTTSMSICKASTSFSGACMWSTPEMVLGYHFCCLPLCLVLVILQDLVAVNIRLAETIEFAEINDIFRPKAQKLWIPEFWFLSACRQNRLGK